MKRFFNDFKDFISKGNILDLAVGVIIGGAFGKIVTSLVNDIIMPFIVLVSGKNSLSELSWTLRQAVIENGVVVQSALTLNWGNFLQTIIDFLIIGFTVFLFVKLLMAAKDMGDRLSKEALTAVEKKMGNKDKRKTEKTKALTDAEVEAPFDESVIKTPSPVPQEAPLAQTLPSTEDGLKNIETLLTEIRNALQKEQNTK